MKKSLTVVVFLSCFTFFGCDSGGSSKGPKNPITVVAMGDSQTSGGNYAGVPPWPSLLAAEEPEWTVVNLAVSGETSAGGAGRIGGALRRNPDVVVIMYGANDAIQSLSSAAFERNLVNMVSAAKASGARVVLVDVMPFFGARRIYNGNAQILNNIIAQVASREKTALVRASRLFRGDDAAALFPDGLHPNADATRILYVNIREKINSVASDL